MKLNEILNRKVDYKVEEASKTYFRTSAIINGRKIVFAAELNDTRGDNNWDVEFAEKDDNDDLNHDATGSGAEFEVFAMVKDSLMEFIKKYKPDLIKFSADKARSGSETRANLYNRLLKKFKTPGYSFERHEGELRDTFYLEKD